MYTPGTTGMAKSARAMARMMTQMAARCIATSLAFNHARNIVVITLTMASIKK